MSSVVALVPDLLFGSKVKATLEAGGHDVQLVPTTAAVRERAAGAGVVVVDLAGADVDPAEVIDAVRGAGARTLAAYSHVDADTRRRASDAGFDLVVPRSRLVREGAELVGRLATSGD